MVLGLITSTFHGTGYKPVDIMGPVIQRLRAHYGNRFGGIMGWEYYEAGVEDEKFEEPWEWVKTMGIALGRVEAGQQNIP